MIPTIPFFGRLMTPRLLCVLLASAALFFPTQLLQAQSLPGDVQILDETVPEDLHIHDRTTPGNTLIHDRSAAGDTLIHDQSEKAVDPQSHTHADQAAHTHLPVDYSFHEDAGQYTEPRPDENGYRWWKGNLHTHTLWSDGDQFPEVIAQWYRQHGYNFLALSDHNVLSRGDRWIPVESRRLTQRGDSTDILAIYRQRFGDQWVETRNTGNDTEVRLKPLNEVRTLFEEAGRFVMIESEEITEPEYTIHVNATNILKLIEPDAGTSVEETIRLNIDAVEQQGRETGRAMIPHLNHPNFRTAVTAEDMAPVENMRLFEVYNGHRDVLNYGNDEGTEDLDRVWDIVLTLRLGELGLEPVFGMATDDAHNYESSRSETAVPGRGWVQVRSRFLSPEHIVRALRSGDFYSSSGVTIRSFKMDETGYSVYVEPEEGVEYTIQFIGTRKGYDASSESYVDEEGNAREDRTRIYSNDIGEILMEVQGTGATYEFDGNELYVRAKVISTKLKENWFLEGEFETAWLQPVRVAPPSTAVK